MARILLIDDDDSVRTMIRMSLTGSGHTVTEARDGREGLRRFSGSAADLVITDLVMPEKEGIEVIIELRKLNPQLKIMAVSGGGRTGSTNYLRMAGLLGATKVLAKPFAIEELSAAIQQLLLPGDAAPAPPD